MRILAPLLLATALGPASAAVVTFDDFMPRSVFTETTIVSEGFRFSTVDVFLGVEDRPPTDLAGNPLPGAFNGTPSLIYSLDPLAIMAVGGGAFFLQQLDLGLSFFVPDNEVGGLATISYVLAAGGSGSMSVALDRSYSTVTINQEVLSVSIEGGRRFGYVTLDNLVVRSLPEPASAGLALVALLGAGGASLRRRAPLRGTAP